MLFRRDKKTGTLSSGLLGSAWDEKTVAWFADQKKFNVQITSVRKTMTCGRWGPIEDAPTPEFEASGVMACPRLIAVEITLEPPDKSTEPFGIFRYNYNPARVARGNEWITAKVPLLQIALDNLNNETATTIFEAHRDALLSGQRRSLVRFWKEEGVGMADEDKEQGRSWGPYSIFGITIWDTLESERLPRWALPFCHENFSLDALPDHSYQLRL